MEQEEKKRLEEERDRELAEMERLKLEATQPAVDAATLFTKVSCEVVSFNLCSWVPKNLHGVRYHFLITTSVKYTLSSSIQPLTTSKHQACSGFNKLYCLFA